jgi:hypothetical protein
MYLLGQESGNLYDLFGEGNLNALKPLVVGGNFLAG